MKKLVSVCLVALLLLALPLPAAAQSARASSLRLAKTEGSVTLRDKNGNGLTPRDNMSLYSGYSVGTAGASYAYVNLDDEKAVKLAADSEAEVKQKDRLLELLLHSGELLFDVAAPVAADETFAIRAGNTVTGVLGTAGVVCLPDELTRQFYLLDGHVRILVADYFTGQQEQVELGPGEFVEVLTHVEAGNLTETNTILRRRLEVGDIRGYVAVYIAGSPELQRRILEAGTFTQAELDEIIGKAKEWLRQEEEAAARLQAGLDKAIAAEENNAVVDPLWKRGAVTSAGGASASGSSSASGTPPDPAASSPTSAPSSSSSTPASSSSTPVPSSSSTPVPPSSSSTPVPPAPTPPTGTVTLTAEDLFTPLGGDVYDGTAMLLNALVTQNYAQVTVNANNWATVVQISGAVPVAAGQTLVIDASTSVAPAGSVTVDGTINLNSSFTVEGSMTVNSANTLSATSSCYFRILGNGVVTNTSTGRIVFDYSESTVKIADNGKLVNNGILEIGPLLDMSGSGRLLVEGGRVSMADIYAGDTSSIHFTGGNSVLTRDIRLDSPSGLSVAGGTVAIRDATVYTDGGPLAVSGGELTLEDTRVEGAHPLVVTGGKATLVSGGIITTGEVAVQVAAPGMFHYINGELNARSQTGFLAIDGPYTADSPYEYLVKLYLENGDELSGSTYTEALNSAPPGSVVLLSWEHGSGGPFTFYNPITIRAGTNVTLKWDYVDVKFLSAPITVEDGGSLTLTSVHRTLCKFGGTYDVPLITNHGDFNLDYASLDVDDEIRLSTSETVLIRNTGSLLLREAAIWFPTDEIGLNGGAVIDNEGAATVESSEFSCDSPSQALFYGYRGTGELTLSGSHIALSGDNNAGIWVQESGSAVISGSHFRTSGAAICNAGTSADSYVEITACSMEYLEKGEKGMIDNSGMGTVSLDLTDSTRSVQFQNEAVIAEEMALLTFIYDVGKLTLESPHGFKATRSSYDWILLPNHAPSPAPPSASAGDAAPAEEPAGMAVNEAQSAPGAVPTTEIPPATLPPGPETGETDDTPEEPDDTPDATQATPAPAEPEETSGDDGHAADDLPAGAP